MGVSSGLISNVFDENFSFPVHSLLLKGGSKGTFLDMLREKLRLMMLRDVTTFSTSSLVLSAPSPPPRKYDNRGSRWTTLISPISNYRFFLTFYILVHISLAFQIFTRNKIYIYMYRDTIINTNLNVKIPLFIFSRLVRISFSRAKQYTYIIRINIFNKSDVNIRMMRISYSTPGDAYNRVTVVSPRKCERIF